ncbi:hypothetical protein [Paenibacillus sacheonensis]|uniref:Uncharacterized protein n=1 Tax=Paenibacillus sacheonensis TaxID=742054 RepID=A0A7X5BZS5_9BACL|nr:hypothetical protein [Paenibacillus sacheonensis]MBM7568327.1 hypothetical protein [Paenibacillus sacheonensis]NBC68490.1 hypothetical protein [Paenibacillus sacheonensis]
MAKKKSKKRQHSARRAARMIGAAAAVMPLAISVPIIASAYTEQGPQSIANIDGLLANAYSAALIAGNSFTIDLDEVFQNADELEYTVIVQNAPVADVYVAEDGETGKSLRIGLNKTGMTKVDLQVRNPESDTIVHERFTLNVRPNSDLNSSGTATVGDVVRYYNAHPERFTTAEDARRLLQAAVTSSAPPVNHAPQANPETQHVNLLLDEEDESTMYASIELSDYFSDEDGDSLAYEMIDGPGPASSGSFAYGKIVEGSTLELHARGSSGEGAEEFVVEATDESGEKATKTFRLTAAWAPEPENHAPVAHTIGDENTFSIRYGQSADIDLSQMFEDIDGDELVYDFDIDSEYVGVTPNGSKLELHTTGSPSVTKLTVMASDDGEENWVPQTITIIPEGWADLLTDKTYSNAQATTTIDLSVYFDGTATYSASAEGSVQPSVAGTKLKLELTPDSNSSVNVDASDGHGLTIHDTFDVHVVPGIVVQDIGQQYLQDNGDGGFNAEIDLSSVFSGATSYRVTDHDVDLFGSLSSHMEWSNNALLSLQTLGSVYGTSVTVEGKDSEGETASCRIYLRRNTAPYVWSPNESPDGVFVKKGAEPVKVWLSDGEEDAIRKLKAVSNEETISAKPDIEEGAIIISGTEPGSGNVVVDVTDGLPGGAAHFTLPVYVYEEKVDFDGWNDWSASLDVSAYLDELDTSENSELTVTVNGSSLIDADGASMDGAFVYFNAKADPQYPEAPMLGRELVTLSISDGHKTKLITVYINHLDISA